MKLATPKSNKDQISVIMMMKNDGDSPLKKMIRQVTTRLTDALTLIQRSLNGNVARGIFCASRPWRKERYETRILIQLNNPKIVASETKSLNTLLLPWVVFISASKKKSDEQQTATSGTLR